MPRSKGAPAPVFPCFTPAADQSTVDHLKIKVSTVTPQPDGGLSLSVTSGDLGFDVFIPAIPGRPGYQPGDRLCIDVKIWATEIGREDVPAWAEVQQACFGSTEWRSKFSEYIR